MFILRSLFGRFLSAIIFGALSISMVMAAYIVVPNTASPKELISSSKYNANFDAIENGLSDGTKDLNVYRYYVSGQKVIDYNREINCTNLIATGNLGIYGDLTVTGNLYVNYATLSVGTLNATVISGNGVTTQTNGAADANKIPRLNSDGHLDDDLLAYDIYNFYVKYPYAASTPTETIQEQLIYANGTITAVKAVLGTDATGTSFVIDVMNNLATVNATGQTYTFSDVTDTISINAGVNTNVIVTANNILQLQIEQIGFTIPGQDLRVQVIVKRRD